MLVNGVWQENWQPVQAKDEQGRFIRQASSFRHWITPDGAPGPIGAGDSRPRRGAIGSMSPTFAPGRHAH